ncbi:hypothetical protein PTSG_03963 [Salpingoeca rosetta]|uniref:MARVEL domain-containing protein n=1 Tax=Salpingoeca rosetta (strain ATCC 50818 / BSB-021) TaxID=946362 RepID=F2U7D8_SALR5|nr:uncharacterized protein PTSG_03963 [Salpingoeca rosetta]EGD83355.1 hypothetical protein PTSG_03963 [Salpingoeca rosetta]|eukprot:XP_004994859.1 hypothetical protein PTSG_03963 [Salpingoeca rosetta]
MACETFSRALWCVLVLLTSVVLTLAFVTSYWVETKSSVLALGYDSISLGLVYACLQRVGFEETCGQYGTGLQDIPVTSWRSAALFYGTGLFLAWLTFLLTLISFVKPSFKPALRHLMMGAFWLIVLGLFIFGASIGELKYHPNASIFQPCEGAGAFKPGSACLLGDSGVIACVGMGLCLVSASAGYFLDTDVPDHNEQEEQEAAQRKLSA